MIRRSRFFTALVISNKKALIKRAFLCILLLDSNVPCLASIHYSSRAITSNKLGNFTLNASSTPSLRVYIEAGQPIQAPASFTYTILCSYLTNVISPPSPFITGRSCERTSSIIAISECNSIASYSTHSNLATVAVSLGRRPREITRV